MIQTKRAYEPAGKTDGKRFLVDRLWPRGVKKETLKIEAWTKDVAPSQALRRWFNHDPAKWNGFQQRYRGELAEKPEAWQPLLHAAKEGKVTLVFGAHDPEHNNAIVLKSFLDQRVRRKASGGHTGS